VAATANYSGAKGRRILAIVVPAIAFIYLPAVGRIPALSGLLSRLLFVLDFRFSKHAFFSDYTKV